MTTSEIRVIDAEPEQPDYVATFLRTSGAECAFIECYTARATPILLAELERAGKKPEDVRYVVVTHAHLDHAGGAGTLMQACPNATLLAHPRAARHLIDPTKLVASATAVYGEETFARVYGEITPIPKERVRVLEDGETFELGGETLRVMHTLGHAKHHFVVIDEPQGTVFTGDAFGLVYPRLQRAGTFALPSTSPTDFDPEQAIASVSRIASLGSERLHLTHMGEVTDIQPAAEQLRQFLARSAELLDQAKRKKDDPNLTAWLRAEVRRAVDEAAAKAGLTLDDTDRRLLETDITLNGDGIAFVAGRG